MTALIVLCACVIAVVDSYGLAKAGEMAKSSNLVSCVAQQRREFLRRASVLVSVTSVAAPGAALAAPPTSVIAEELGYFPVSGRDGELQYVPARVRGQSTDQAVALAKHLNKKGVVMYSAFWCPHCRNQREMFGRDAWKEMTWVECGKGGVGRDERRCKNVDGFPTFLSGKNEVGSGEMSLAKLAELSGFAGFDEKLEPERDLSGSGSCR